MLQRFLFFPEIVALLRCWWFWPMNSSSVNQSLCLSGNANLGTPRSHHSLPDLKVSGGGAGVEGFAFPHFWGTASWRDTSSKHCCEWLWPVSAEDSSLRVYSAIKRRTKPEKGRKTEPASRCWHNSVCGFWPTSSAFLGLAWPVWERRSCLQYPPWLGSHVLQSYRMRLLD